MDPIDRNSLPDAAAARIRSALSERRWAVGEKLPNEAALADELAISRATVREAVKILVAQGLLETRQGSGTYVLSRVSPLPALLGARSASLRDLFEARCALDVEAARLAAVRATPAQLQLLRAILAARGEFAPGVDRDTFIERDFAFHRAIVETSGNRALVDLYVFFSGSIEETIAASLGDSVPEPGLAAHRALIDAIGTGDADRADRAVRAFLAPMLAALAGESMP
jgi:DNA-binding FadR family transcriptional regulator